MVLNMMYVDIHESRSKIPGILKSVGVPIEMVPLEVGDYVVSGQITACCELKSVSDYLSSLESGRLNQELLNMTSAYECNVLIVYGFLKDALQHRKMKRTTYFEYLAGCIVHRSSLNPEGAVSVVNFDTIYDAAVFLKTVHSIIADDRVDRLPTAKRFKIPDGMLKTYTIKSIPGVGIERAKRLKKYFGNIKNLSNASVEQLMQVKGIGKGISKYVYKYLNEE